MTVLQALLQGEKADAIFTDLPWNVPVAGHIRGNGRVKHREFAMASGEMSPDQFDAFMQTTLGNLAASAKDGSIALVFNSAGMYRGATDSKGRFEVKIWE